MNVEVNNKMVHICLDGVGHKYGIFWTAIMSENPSSFFNLQYMLMVKETPCGQKVQHLMGRCHIHNNTLVEVMVVEIREGMAEEDVDEVHNNVIPDSKKMEAIEGILIEGGASTNLHQQESCGTRELAI